MHSADVQMLDLDTLKALAETHRVAYSEAKPFPHIVVDDFLNEEILSDVLDEFPGPEAVNWGRFHNPSEKKLALRDETQMGHNTRRLFHSLNSSVFVSFLEALTGIEGLIPDPYLWGGGLHQIKKGGFLKVHADFNWYSKLRLDRRLNILIYLNRDWKEEYGGHLELWNKEMTRCEKKISPIFNRCVVFTTTDHSFHGHPDPLNCLDNQTRKSLALYYYTNGRPADEASPVHTTLFQRRPGEGLGASVFSFLTRLTPPILLEAKERLTKSRSRSS